jgi:hypothetical protein
MLVFPLSFKDFAVLHVLAKGSVAIICFDDFIQAKACNFFNIC